VKRVIIAAALFAATPAWANPPGYDSSWTSKEAADAAIAADWDYGQCVFQHLWNYAKKTQEPAATVVPASVAACYFERVKLLSAMRKAQPTWELDWLDKRDKEVEPKEMSIVLDARSG
jgi:hypothetical protein